MRCIKSVEQSRNHHLSSVRVSGKNKVKSGLTVILHHLRAVCQQNRENAVPAERRTVGKLILPQPSLSVGKAVRVIDSADKKAAASGGKHRPLALKHRYALTSQAVFYAVRIVCVYFVVAGDIERRKAFSDIFCQRKGFFVRDTVVGNIPGHHDGVRGQLICP